MCYPLTDRILRAPYLEPSVNANVPFSLVENLLTVLKMSRNLVPFRGSGGFQSTLAWCPLAEIIIFFALFSIDPPP